MTAATRWLFGVSDTYVAQSIGLYVGLAALVLWSAPDELSGRGLGPANRVTLGRSTLVLPVSALALEPAGLPDEVWWWVIAVSTIAMVCDGVDGSVARRTGTSTAFGARFDMELDSFLALALSILVWRSGKVGPWILLIGAFRYLFVLAGWLWAGVDRRTPPEPSAQNGLRRRWRGLVGVPRPGHPVVGGIPGRGSRAPAAHLLVRHRHPLAGGPGTLIPPSRCRVACIEHEDIPAACVGRQERRLRSSRSG